MYVNLISWFVWPFHHCQDFFIMFISSSLSFNRRRNNSFMRNWSKISLFLFNNCLLFACTCDFFLHADFTSFSTIQSLIWQNVNHIIYWMKFLSYSFTISYVNDDEISLYSAFALLFLAGSFEVWLIVWSLWFVEWMNHNFDPTLSEVYCFYFDD